MPDGLDTEDGKACLQNSGDDRVRSHILSLNGRGEKPGEKA